MPAQKKKNIWEMDQKELEKELKKVKKEIKQMKTEMEKHPPEALQYLNHSYIQVDALLRELDKYGKRLIISFNDASYETLQMAMDNAGEEINVRAEKELIKVQSKNIELTVKAITNFIKDAVDRTITEENKIK